MANLIGPMPVVDLFGAAIIQFEAVDPVSGAPVSGVQVSQASISAEDHTVLPDENTAPSVPNTAIFLPGPGF